MSITPIGGWREPQSQLQGRPQQSQIEQNPPQSGQLLPKTADTCPSCYGTEWKSAGLLYAEGFSVTGSQTQGKFVAVGRSKHAWQVGAGRYKGSTRGVSQTLLSGKAAPPKPGTVHVFFAVICCIAILFGWGTLHEGGTVPVIAFLLAAGLFWLTIRTRRNEKNMYQRAMETYENLRMCTRCGAFYNGG